MNRNTNVFFGDKKCPFTFEVVHMSQLDAELI